MENNGFTPIAVRGDGANGGWTNRHVDIIGEQGSINKALYRVILAKVRVRWMTCEKTTTPIAVQSKGRIRQFIHVILNSITSTVPLPADKESECITTRGLTAAAAGILTAACKCFGIALVGAPRQMEVPLIA